MAIVSMNVSVNGPGTIPLGAIIPVGNVGAWALPASGEIKDGFVRCDGAAFPAGSHPSFTGNIPDLTDSRFLQGSNTVGGTGGANSKTLATAELPAHTHNNTLSNATVASSSHTHDMKHNHQWVWMTSDDQRGEMNAYTEVNPSKDVFASGRRVFYHYTEGIASSADNVRSYVGPEQFRDQPYFTSRAIASRNSSIPYNQKNDGVNYDWIKPENITYKDNTGTPSGSTTVSITNANTGSGTAFDIRPQYFGVVYLMRVI